MTITMNAPVITKPTPQISHVVTGTPVLASDPEFWFGLGPVDVP